MALGKDGHIKLVQNVDDTGAAASSGVGNRSSFTTFQKNVTTAGTGVNVTAQAVPNGFSVVVKAKKTNTGLIYVGSSKANAENHAVAFSLAANEDIKLQVTNTNLAWIDSDVSGEGVEVITET
jgi:hypothetical protein